LCDEKKREKVGAKIFLLYTDIVIFVLGYFILNHLVQQHVMPHHPESMNE